MDFLSFHEQLASDDLKAIKPTDAMLKFTEEKYADAEIIDCYKLKDNLRTIYFKHKLWEKLAIFDGDQWVETRVSSLKNQLPEATLVKFEKKLKKKYKIIKLESVIPADGDFFFYIICKLSGKKKVLHVTRDGDVLVNVKYLDYKVKIEEEEEDEPVAAIEPEKKEPVKKGRKPAKKK